MGPSPNGFLLWLYFFCFVGLAGPVLARGGKLVGDRRGVPPLVYNLERVLDFLKNRGGLFGLLRGQIGLSGLSGYLCPLFRLKALLEAFLWVVGYRYKKTPACQAGVFCLGGD